MKRPALILSALVCLLAVPAAAQAGCWATVSLSSQPQGIQAGDAWNVEITVKQHGRTLLANAKPAVTITDARGDQTRFAARKTARKGVYRASVVFPTAGRWSYTIFDGFVPSCAHQHSYPRVSILDDGA